MSQQKEPCFLNNIKIKLEKNFKITDDDQILVEDKSYLHVGHENLENIKKEDYPSHLHIKIKSSKFKDLSILEKHKMIYSTLKDEISQLHAISIDAE